MTVPGENNEAERLADSVLACPYVVPCGSNPRCEVCQARDTLDSVITNHGRCRSAFHKAIAERDRLAAQVETLREALGFYADPENYRYWAPVGMSRVRLDDGRDARAALGSAGDGDEP